jgi:hypothetical protein
MVRRPVAVLALAAASCTLLGCRGHTVSVDFSPAVGDRYSYRYEIEATITRRVEGADPKVVHVDTVLVAQQQVQALTQHGARIRLVLTREQGAPRTATVLVDRVGSLEGIELVDDLEGAGLGVGDTGVVPTQVAGPPDRPLAPGDEWSIDEAAQHGTGRLTRLGVIDGADVAVVRTTVTEDIDEAGEAGGSGTLVTGALHSTNSTSYDLADGAVRRSRSRSHGTLQAVLAPPPGVAAEAVHATIGYDVTVRVVRTHSPSSSSAPG